MVDKQLNHAFKVMELDTDVQQVVVNDMGVNTLTKLLRVKNGMLSAYVEDQTKAFRAADAAAMSDFRVWWRVTMVGKDDFEKELTTEVWRNFQPPDPSATALLPQQAEQIAQMHAYIEKKEAEERTVEISHPGTTKFNRIIHRAGINLSAPNWNDKPDSLEDLAMVSHGWLPGKEDSPENRTHYMAYLNNRNNITPPLRGNFF